MTPFDLPDEAGHDACLTITRAKLLQLFCSGTLHAEDLCCLDRSSKDLIRRLLLRSLSSANPPKLPRTAEEQGL